MGFFEKAERFLGKSIVRDIGHTEAASTVIGSIGNKIREGAVSSIKATKYEEGSNIIEKALQNPFGYEVKRRYQAAIGAVLVLPAMVDSGMQVHNKNKMGRTEGAGLANQINESHSSTIDDDQQLEQVGKTSIKNRIKDGNINTYGAEGNIVMALHNLRGGR